MDRDGFSKSQQMGDTGLTTHTQPVSWPCDEEDFRMRPLCT